MNSLILTSATRIVAALMLVLSVFLLLRGHNEPGGGFIGGLVGATAFALYAIGHGVAEARRALRVQPMVLAALGLLAALGAGLAAYGFGDQPFTGQWLFIKLDPEAEGYGLPLSSVLVFDIGVYLVVLGTLLAILFALEEEG